MDYTPKPILTDEDPILKQVSEPVTEFDHNLHQLVATMVSTMIHANGVGLSAVQIGVLQRVIVVNFEGKTTFMANPVFLRKGNRFETKREGCLSIKPSKWRDVSRPVKCEVEFQDLFGNKHTLNMSGMMARIVQHEMDHLDGILITDLPPAPRI